MKTRCLSASLAGTAALFGLVAALPVYSQHVTDGQFTGPVEWDTSRPTVTSHFFAPGSDGSGNAWLYTEHVTQANLDKLYLMYDYVGSSVGATAANSFFNVFFDVNGGPDPNAYLVHFDSTGFTSFERPLNSPAPIDSNNSFILGPGSGWVPLTPQDLSLASFQAAEMFGSSPNNPNNHLMAEFELTVGEPSNSGKGIYSPDPAFWSASEGGNDRTDPPISSGIFQLNPDGTTSVDPILGPNGGPILIPTQQGAETPEPGSMALLVGAGLSLSLFAFKRRR